ncbi:15916_t:CDS:2 [Rhizophagus irregularis]|nr:15916_t:CDS:2 [Rhizophagus irregularis]
MQILNHLRSAPVESSNKAGEECLRLSLSSLVSSEVSSGAPEGRVAIGLIRDLRFLLGTDNIVVVETITKSSHRER